MGIPRRKSQKACLVSRNPGRLVRTRCGWEQEKRETADASTGKAFGGDYDFSPLSLRNIAELILVLRATITRDVVHPQEKQGRDWRSRKGEKVR